MAKIIDGKQISRQTREEIAADTAEFVRHNRRKRPRVTGLRK